MVSVELLGFHMRKLSILVEFQGFRTFRAACAESTEIQGSLIIVEWEPG